MGRPGAARAGAVLAALLAGALLARDAAAQGFKIQEGGPSLGNAGAGSAATADDPTTVWFNPAGMARFEGDRGAALLNVIAVSMRYRDGGSEGLRGGRVRGGNGKDAGGLAFVPSFYAVTARSEDLRFGIGVNQPFGLSTDYGDSWAGRYHATKSALTVLNVNPAVAWKADEDWSLGAGLDLQQVRAGLENAVDFGSIGEKELGAARAAQLGLVPQGDDGKAELTGSSFGVGLNAGVHWQAGERTRLGLAWRSGVHHRVEGRADFTVPPDARRLTAAGDFRDADAKLDLYLPATVLLGAVHDPAPGWSLLGGLEWTNWSRFRRLRVEFDSRQDPLVQRQGWGDTFRPMAGVTWRPDGRWTLRVGGSYDQSPVSDEERLPRLPDAARISIAAGVGYRISKGATLEVGYIRFWTDRVPLDQVDHEAAGRIRGSARSVGDYLGVTLTWDF